MNPCSSQALWAERKSMDPQVDERKEEIFCGQAELSTSPLT